MYGARLDVDRFLTAEFVEGVEEFLSFAFNHEEGNFVSRGNIRCFYVNCKNLKYLDRKIVTLHLYKKGFVREYDTWYLYYESYVYEYKSSNIQNPRVYDNFSVFPAVVDTSN